MQNSMIMNDRKIKGLVSNFNKSIYYIKNSKNNSNKKSSKILNSSRYQICLIEKLTEKTSKWNFFFQMEPINTYFTYYFHFDPPI